MKKPVALDMELIVVIVDGGNGHDVIDYAKEAGANGGTILHGRGAGVHDSGKFLGLEIEPEKDVVLVIVPTRFTNRVLDRIGEGIEIRKPGNGIAFSIEISKVIGITKIHENCQVFDMDEILKQEENDKDC